MVTDWAALKPCGTPAAYRRHLRHGETPCLSCKQAEARAYQDRHQAAKDARNAARRQRYAAAIAAGANPRSAKQRRDWRTAA